MVWNHTIDFKSNSRYALVRFWNHAYDLRPNCTPLCSITIINNIKYHWIANTTKFCIFNFYFEKNVKYYQTKYDLTITGVEKSGISGALNWGTKEQRPQITITNEVTKNTAYGYCARTAECLEIKTKTCNKVLLIYTYCGKVFQSPLLNKTGSGSWSTAVNRPRTGFKFSLPVYKLV